MSKKDTKFPAGKSGNPVGRPKGSKNKITLLKLMGEEAVRSGKMEEMLEVAALVIEQAKNGDKSSQKLVWDSIMSKGVSDAPEAKEKVEIKIGTFKPEEKPIEGEVIVEETKDETIE